MFIIVNLGKWVLRYLFAHLIEEEAKRDQEYRETLQARVREANEALRLNAPGSIDLPTINIPRTSDSQITSATVTPRPSAGAYVSPGTPGHGIGIISPGVQPSLSATQTGGAPLPPTAEEGSAITSQDQSVSSSERPSDYFSANPNAQPPDTSSPDLNTKSPVNSEEDSSFTALPPSSAEPDKEEKSKKGSSLFSKKFQMNFPKKLSRNSTETKPTATEEKPESEKSSTKEEKVYEDTFTGVVEKMRDEYQEYLTNHPVESLETLISPSPENETPHLSVPSNVAIMIQEEHPDSAVAADLYRGSVESVGREIDEFEKAAPKWLGDLLLRVRISVPSLTTVQN
jgi:WD repeat-containing protein 48